MDDIERKVIVSARSFLERLANSDILPVEMQTEAHMAVTALGYQIARGSYDPERLALVRTAEEALSTELETTIGRTVLQAAPRKWQSLWQSEVGAQLTAAVEYSPADPEERQGLTIEDERQVAQQLRNFLVNFHEPMDPTVSAGTRSTYQGGRGDARASDEAEAIYITAPTLQKYLRERFSEHAVTCVLEVKRLMGGYSKETYIVRLETAAGEEKIVIRKDGYGLPTGSSVDWEFDVFKEVFALGLPVPEPLWLETDPKHFSASFMAVRFVDGKPAHLNVPTDIEARGVWCENLALALAKLHRLTSKPDMDVRAVIREDLADLQRRIQERERSPHPGLAFGMAWLVDHLDDLVDRPAVRIHGYVGFHNILMSGDDIVALLDWEYSHFSDPIEDLVYVKLFLDQIDGWDRFLKSYETASGFVFEKKAARYFGVWKEVRNLVACLGSLNSLLLPQVKDVALSVAGTIYIPKYEIAVLDAILEGD